jgi:hypothetical protein
MAASTGIAIPITPRRIGTNAAGIAQVNRSAEKATQTFLQGTPVQFDVAGATGFIIACPAMTSVATALMAGFSVEPGSNLSTSGVAKTQNLTQVPPNQPNAVITPLGAPINDGTVGFAVADNTTEFIGVLGDSSNNALAVLAQVQVGAIFGLFKDPGNSFWYVDHNVTTVAGGACVVITALVDAIGKLNGRVMFKVLDAVQQLQ